MFRLAFILGLCLPRAFSAGYLPLSTTDSDALRTNEALMELAYSKPAFNSVGTLCGYATSEHRNISEFEISSGGSAVLISKNICMAAAHCYKEFLFEGTFLERKIRYEVGFEIRGQQPKYYRVKRFIIHPDYKANSNYDVALLILENPVEELPALKINYGFSKHQEYQYDQCLLTYVGYGGKIFANNWLCMTDNKRKAIQAHTSHCSLKKESLGIYSTPYGLNIYLEKKRPLEPYEVGILSGMSGGGVLNMEDELVGIVECLKHKKLTFAVKAYLWGAEFINFFIRSINSCGYNIPRLNIEITPLGSWTQSMPLGACKNWIESIQRQYDDAYFTEAV